MLEKDKVYVNKTLKYLFPTIKYYNEDFVNYIKRFPFCGVFIADDNQKILGVGFYIAFDLNSKKMEIKSEFNNDFIKFLKWLQNQDYYIKDYAYKKNKNDFHIIVVDIPKKSDKAYIKFILDRYSEMYNSQEIQYLFNGENTFFIKQIKENILRVLSFDNQKRELKELDTGIKLNEEILNYK